MRNYNYITIEESQSINYFRIPKQLFTDEFKEISTDSKLLYGLMLERTGLSLKNNWFNEHGHVYIIYTVEELICDLNCSNKSVNKYISELKEKGLIEIVRRGLGKPNIIFVKSLQNVHFKKCKKYISRSVKNTSTEVKKVHGNNTDMSNTDMSNNITPYIPQGEEVYEEEIFVENEELIEDENDTSLKVEVVSDFEIFWKAYPKKVGKNKAKSVLEKILKRKNHEEILNLILKDLSRRKSFSQWLIENGRYIPNPATYLSQERWLDEYQTVPAVKTSLEKLQELYEEEERKTKCNE